MKPYAAVEITFLNRSDEVERAMTYPVTRIVLRERDHPDRGRVFTVTPEGCWHEETGD